MKFIVELQYKQDRPFPECLREPSDWIYDNGTPFEDDWTLEIRDFDHLKELCERIEKNAFIEFGTNEHPTPTIVFARNLD